MLVRPKHVACVLSFAALSPWSSAQGIQTLTLTGQTLPGIGTITNIVGVAVNDSGQAAIDVIVGPPGPSAHWVMIDGAGAVLAQTGQSVSDPAGAVLASFLGEGEIDSAGEPYVYAQLTGAVTSGVDDLAFYKGTALQKLLQLGAVSTASQLPTGSKYVSLLPPKYNSSGGLCFNAMYDDPHIAGTFDAKALITADPTTAAQNVICKKGDVLPGQTWAVTDIDWNSLAFNDSGQVLFKITNGGPLPTQGVLYRDSTVIVQTGVTTSWGGDYSSIGNFHMNNVGEWVAKLKAGGWTVTRNGQTLISEGDALPAIHPYKFTALGQPVMIGDDGRVLWWGQWVLPGPDVRRGIFIDYALIVETKETQIGGSMVENFDDATSDFSLSPSGQFLIFEATLAGGVEGVFLVDLW